MNWIIVKRSEYKAVAGEDKRIDIPVERKYSDKASKAEDSVKYIALKAIENSTKIQMVTKQGKVE